MYIFLCVRVCVCVCKTIWRSVVGARAHPLLYQQFNQQIFIYYMHTYMHVYTHTYIHECTSSNRKSAWTLIHARLHTYIHTYMNAPVPTKRAPGRASWERILLFICKYYQRARLRRASARNTPYSWRHRDTSQGINMHTYIHTGMRTFVRINVIHTRTPGARHMPYSLLMFGF